MTEHRPLIVVAGRHRPHEQLLLAYSALLGVAYLAGTVPPASVAAMLPGWAVSVWAAGLAVSGMAGLLGCWWRGERGLGVEAGALLINAGALVLYSAAVFAAAGVGALLPGGIVLAWALANVWRAGQARKDLQPMRGSE